MSGATLAKWRVLYFNFSTNAKLYMLCLQKLLFRGSQREKKTLIWRKSNKTSVAAAVVRVQLNNGRENR